MRLNCNADVEAPTRPPPTVAATANGVATATATIATPNRPSRRAPIVPPTIHAPIQGARRQGPSLPFPGSTEVKRVTFFAEPLSIDIESFDIYPWWMPQPTVEPIGLHLARTTKAVNRAFDDALSEAGGSI